MPQFLNTKLNIIFILALSSIFACRSRNHNDQAHTKDFFDFLNGGNSFDSEVVGKRNCSSEYIASHHLVSPKLSTRVYHWTKDEYALTNPHEYISGIVKASNEKNSNFKPFSNDSSIKMIGAVGAGFYVASNPYASYEYGPILVSFEIQTESKIPKFISLKEEEFQRESVAAQEANCPGFLYPYLSRKISDSNTKEPTGIAIVLWDLGAVNPKSVISVGPKSNINSKFGPYFEILLNNRSAMEKILYSEFSNPQIAGDISKLNEIRKYWEEQPSVSEWE